MANQQGNSSQPQAAGEEMSEILRIRREKLFKMQEEGRDPYLHTRFETDCKAQEILEHFEELENQPVSVAGRIMSRRGMGKVAFPHTAWGNFCKSLGGDHPLQGPAPSAGKVSRPDQHRCPLPPALS